MNQPANSLAYMYWHYWHIYTRKLELCSSVLEIYYSAQIGFIVNVTLELYGIYCWVTTILVADKNSNPI